VVVDIENGKWKFENCGWNAGEYFLGIGNKTVCAWGLMEVECWSLFGVDVNFNGIIVTDG
jgi:hypothetical protein